VLEIFIEYIALRDNSWQLEELRSSAKFARSSHKYAHADLAREYQDNGGRMEVRETHYYYYIYDSKGKINESPAANSVDLRV